MQNNIHNLLENFLDEGSCESFLRLRQAVAASPAYAPYAETPESVLSTVGGADHEKAQSGLLSIVNGWLLNPGIHTMLAFTYYKLGDERSANVELILGERCLKGILSTGTGEEASPYLVLYTADEYDVLEHLGKKSLAQSLVRTQHRTAYDVHKCDDGTTLWFDVTTPYESLCASQERKN